MVPPTRRGLLKAAGATAAGSLTGCLGPFGGEASRERYPTYRRWLPSDGMEWTFEPRFPPVYSRPASLLGVDTLSERPLTRSGLNTPPALDHEWLETLLHGGQEAYGRLATDRETVESALESDPLRESGGVAAYVVEGGILAVGDSRFGIVVAMAPEVIRRADAAESLVENVSNPPDPGEVELEKPGYDPGIRAVGDASVVWFDQWRDSLAAYAPELDRLVNAWDVGSDRTSLRTVAVFPSEDAADREAIDDWTSADIGPPFDRYEDRSVHLDGRTVLVEGSIDTETLDFFEREPSVR